MPILTDYRIATIRTAWRKLGTKLQRHSTSLHEVADNPATLKDLLKHGHSPNSTNDEGATPLHKICHHGYNCDCAKLLLEAGADPNFDSNNLKNTPLEYARSKNASELVKLME